MYVSPTIYILLVLLIVINREAAPAWGGGILPPGGGEGAYSPTPLFVWPFQGEQEGKYRAGDSVYRPWSYNHQSPTLLYIGFPHLAFLSRIKMFDSSFGFQFVLSFKFTGIFATEEILICTLHWDTTEIWNFFPESLYLFQQKAKNNTTCPPCRRYPGQGCY